MKPEEVLSAAGKIQTLKNHPPAGGFVFLISLSLSGREVV